MRTPTYSADVLAAVLHQRQAATLPELMEALGTPVERTVFRKLVQLDYLSSYSHRGGYYTLREIARFDDRGLWSHHPAWFSQHGTLLATAVAWIEAAEAGYFVHELDQALHVATKDALRKLVQENRIVRAKLDHQYLYVSAHSDRRRHQVRVRGLWRAAPGVGEPLPPDDLQSAELKAALILFFSLLDEKQRRLFAGLESLKAGWGGDQRLAAVLGLDAGTVARGRRELVRGEVERARVRKTGAGRPWVEKKRPTSTPGSKRT